jgi:hypothetical protein
MLGQALADGRAMYWLHAPADLYGLSFCSRGVGPARFRYILGTIQKTGRNKVLPVSDTGEKAYSFGPVGS